MKRSFRVYAICLLIAAAIFSQVGDIGLRSGLVTEDIPRIPSSLVKEVLPYFYFRSAERMAWHPRKRATLVRTYGYGLFSRGQIHRIEYPGGPHRQLTFFEDPVRTVSYGPKGDYLVLSKDADGKELYQN